MKMLPIPLWHRSIWLPTVGGLTVPCHVLVTCAPVCAVNPRTIRFPDCKCVVTWLTMVHTLSGGNISHRFMDSWRISPVIQSAQNHLEYKTWHSKISLTSFILIQLTTQKLKQLLTNHKCKSTLKYFRIGVLFYSFVSW